jgi:hypothetical protein
MPQSFLNRNDVPVGLQNNNIGNLRGNDAWEGKVGMSASGGYVQFADISWGIRAFLVNLYTQISKYGLDTPKKYISKYAPSFENDTTSYINKFTTDIGIGENDKIPTDTNSLRKIVRSQMEMELGHKYSDLITDEDINLGISRLNNKVLSFFGASVIFAKNNKVLTIAVALATIGLSYLIYKKVK